MALIESLGYKQDTPRRTGDSSSLLNYSSDPYTTSTSNRRSSQFDYDSKSNFNPSQPLQQLNQNSNFFQSNAFNNSHNNPSSNFISSSHIGPSFYGSPKRNNISDMKDDNGNNSNKYSSIPRKSMFTSGLAPISPIPTKIKYNNHNNNNNNNNNRLNVTKNTNESLMPVSPIKANINNTLFSSEISGIQPNPMESRMSIIHKNNDINIENNKQILIIGFPQSDASFIHRKFRQYGNIVNAKLNKNTLFLQYLNREGSIRALAENAKWIKNGNLTYMISVIYYDIAKKNNQQSGRFLNLNEMNVSQNRNNNMVGTRHFINNGYQNVEKEVDLQSGPTHILWKIFNFITTGW